MLTSDQINEIAAALSKAQAQIQGAQKDGTNPHFKSKYSSLTSVWDACRGPLTANGLSVSQGLSNDDVKLKCTTILLHSSGQFIKSELCMTPQQNTPQAIGSCATYLRRYSLQAIVGVSPDDDDDGNAASLPASNPQHANKPSTQIPIFDPNNKQHREKIYAECLKRKIFGDHQNNLITAMTGKPFTAAELEKLIVSTNPEHPGDL